MTENDALIVDTSKWWVTLRKHPNVQLGAVLETEHVPVLHLHADVQGRWVVSWVVSDEDLFGPSSFREALTKVIDSIPDKELLSLDEEARHLRSVAGGDAA